MTERVVMMGWNRASRAFALAAAAVGLVACGGGDDAPVTATPAPVATRLSGVAAVGAPVAGGKVEVRCSGSTVLETITSATGTWQVDTTGQLLPCATRVSAGTLPPGLMLHSVAVAFGNVNITPLTDLMVANATGKLPSAWWGTSGPADMATFAPASLDKALASLRSAFGLPALETIDPRTVAFSAVPKDKVDDILEALQQALATLGTDYATVLRAATNTAFGLSDGFRVTLNNAYSTITVGGAGGSGGSTGGNTGGNTGGSTGGSTGGNAGAGGAFTLTLNVNASGVAAPPITITNVPKPATQAEFCGLINDPASGIGLAQSLPEGAGTLTIDSCSFSGNTGRIAATLAITSPAAFNVPYSVTYTYN